MLFDLLKYIMLQDKDEQAFKHFQQVLRLAPDHKKAMETYKKAKLLKQKKEEGLEYSYLLTTKFYNQLMKYCDFIPQKPLKSKWSVNKTRGSTQDPYAYFSTLTNSENLYENNITRVVTETASNWENIRVRVLSRAHENVSATVDNVVHTLDHWMASQYGFNFS